jgi:HPt (histidine-containing phosphotransfer) domain-containing protein
MSEAIIDSNTFAELKNSLGDDFIAELIEAYCQETPQLIERLQQALALGDASGFRLVAHSIKSSSAAFGAGEFAGLARELEMLGKAGDLGSAGPGVARLAREYEKVASVLREKQHGA